MSYEVKNPINDKVLQRRLSEEVTVLVNSRSDYEGAVEASQILFGKGTTESLKKMTENTFLSVFEGVPVFARIKEKITSEPLKIRVFPCGVTVLHYTLDK